MRFCELVDLGELQTLCQSFTEATGVATAILDLEGTVLTATGWQDICTRFHRIHPLTAERCRESDTILASQLQHGQFYNVYRCKNGLVDVAVPITIAGEHVANFFIGQFFLQPPDREFFRRQAEQYGFDQAAYFDALAKVPIYTEHTVRRLMDFLSQLARMIGEMGLARKRVEEANAQLQKYQEHLEDLVRERTADLNRAQQIAHIGSWRWDLVTNAVVWSDEMYRIFGLRPDEVSPPTYQTFLSHVHPEDREAVNARLHKARLTRCPFNFDFRIVTSDDQERTLRVFGEVRCDSTGEPVELFGADLDITEEKRVQQALADAKEKAEAANRAKSAFLASMSHELRTPLNAVLGFSRLMKASPDTTATQVETLDVITRSGEHLLSLINNVLSMSKIEAGHVAREDVTFDLHQVVWAIESLMRVHANQKGLEFIVDLAPDLPRRVTTDEGKLRQVLINLVSNAIKYTHQGQVVLRVRVVGREMPHQVRLRVEVEDSGVGISPEDCQRLFSPFVQLAHHASGESGTGLGLAISKQYVELLGGQIGVTSRAGCGSLFHFEISVEVSPESERPVTSRHGRIIGLAPDQPSYRLLIAEDQQENRFLLRRLLEPLGFELREATTGMEAVSLYQQWRPHLIWMDIRMPVMDGMEAIRRIKASRLGTATKIVALTAHALEEERHEILAAGCDDFIRKPFQDAEIFDCLTRHLGVQFLFDDEPITANDQVASLEASQLADLPTVWLTELSKAAERLDGEGCRAVIDQIGQRDSSLGGCLQYLVDTFQYKKLLAVLDRVTGKEVR